MRILLFTAICFGIELPGGFSEEKCRIEISVIPESDGTDRRVENPGKVPVFAVVAHRFEGKRIPAAPDKPDADVVPARIVCGDDPAPPIIIVRTPARVLFSTDQPEVQFLAWHSISQRPRSGCVFLEKDADPFALVIEEASSLPVRFEFRGLGIGDDDNRKAEMRGKGEIVTVDHGLYALTDGSGRGVLELPHGGEWVLRIVTNPFNSVFRATLNGRPAALTGIYMEEKIPAGRSALKFELGAQKDCPEGANNECRTQ